MTPVELVLSKLPSAKRNGRGWMARCPAHDDRNPSLSVAEGDDGRALVKCHAGCATEYVIESIGLIMADLMPDTLQVRRVRTERPPKAKGKTFATAKEAIAAWERQFGPRSDLWPYTDADNKPVGMILRWDIDGDKIRRPVSLQGSGWKKEGMPEPRPLYRLPELKDAKRIYINEGEKAANAAASLGLIATTSAHGSKSSHKTDWTPLAGKDVVILPDNDKAGRKYADTVASILSKLSPRPTVKIVELPDLPESGDMVEYLANRRAAGLNDDTIRAEVEALADAAEAIELELPCLAVEPYKPFPVDALPEPVRGFVSVGAKAIGCDTSFIALPLLSALGSAIGNARRIELKRGWDEPAIVWTAIVGDSGTMKSPALELALRPVRKRQKDEMRNHEKVMEEYEIELQRYERDFAQWRRGKSDADPPVKPEQPVADRCWCDDTTVEALAVLLRDQWRGLLVVRDELAGWIGGFDRYTQGSGADVAKWLEMFGGRSIVVDRKTSGTLYVPRAAVSVAGGIQPETLRRSLGKQHFQNGLAARLLFASPPRLVKRWTEDEISPIAEAALEAVFDRLFRLEPQYDRDGEPQPIIVKLTPKAKAAWVEFFNVHAEQQAELSADLSAAWSKLEGYVARMALVVHMVRCVASDDSVADPNFVDEVSIVSGVELSRWFGYEAKRVYAMLGESEEDTYLRRFVETIRRKGGTMTARELMRSSSRYKTAKDAEEALGELVAEGLAKWEDRPTKKTGGCPTRQIRLTDNTDIDKTPQNPKKETGCVNVNTVNDDSEDIRVAWEERAAICEIEGGLSREAAEAVAEKEFQNVLHSQRSIAYDNTMSPILDEIREAINSSGKSRYRISKDTGISESQLSELMGGTKGLSIEAVEGLAAYLGIEFVTRPKRTDEEE